MPNQLEHSSNPSLPEVEQAIAICRDLGELALMNSQLLEGSLAGVVIRGDSYVDFTEDILNPTKTQFDLISGGKQVFDRKPLSRPTLETTPARELLHLDIEHSPQKKVKPKFPHTLTVGEILEGSAIFVAAQSARRVRALREDQFTEQRNRLNLLPVIRGLRVRNDPSHWFNKTITVEHAGVRGPVGAVYLGPRDAFIVPQGGGKSRAPAWHAVMTTPNVARKSVSYHLDPK